MFFVAHMTTKECLTEVSSRILNFDGVGGMSRSRRLLRTLCPASFTNLLTSRATPSKNFWFLNFTSPSPIIIEFTQYIWFWHFCGFPYIAMRGLVAVFTMNSSIETGQQSDKKKSLKVSQTVKPCRMHPPAMPLNFKKNRSLLHEMRVFEVSMLRYATTLVPYTIQTEHSPRMLTATLIRKVA